jgi:hypothetical protein
VYALKLQVYIAMTDGKKEVSQGKRVVMDLVEPYFGSWRGVAADNFFTSVALAAELFRQGITITGTICPNE